MGRGGVEFKKLKRGETRYENINLPSERKRQDCRTQSTVPNKMADVQFTTISCEPNPDNRNIESHIFCEIRLCDSNIFLC